VQSRPLQQLWKNHLGRLRRACRFGDGRRSGGTALHLLLTRRLSTFPAIRSLQHGDVLQGAVSRAEAADTSGPAVAGIAGESAPAVTVA
jgi:hypothetical protein